MEFCNRLYFIVELIVNITEGAEAMLRSPYNKPKVTPPEGHPRVMLRYKDINRIKENFNHPENKRAYELYQRILNKSFDIYYDEINNGKYNMMLCFMLEANALDCLINANEEKAKDIISITGKVVTNMTTPFISENESVSDKINRDLSKGFSARFGGHVLFVASLVYDWLYPYFADEDKNSFIENCERLAAATQEIGYPPGVSDIKAADCTSPFAGHSNEAGLLRDLLAFGIAAYDERPDIYDYCAGKLFDEFVPAYEFQFQGSFHHQGSAYGCYRYTWLLWAQLLFKSMCEENIFSKNVENVADSFYYLLRSDGEVLRLGDEYTESKGGYSKNHPCVVMHFLAAALTGENKYKKLYLDNYVDEYMLPGWYDYQYYRKGGGAYGEGMYSPTVHLIWNNLTAGRESEPYGKAKHFGYPSGITIYKNEETQTTVFMKIGELWGGPHDHLDMGSFQIYHKGILASDSGKYDLFGEKQHFDYSIRTAAHNCLTIYDPAHKKTIPFRDGDTIYDGGIKIPNKGLEAFSIQHWIEEYTMAKVISHKETENIIEIKGDLTEGYKETCQKVVRKMIFMPNEGQYGIFQIEDEVIAKSEEFIKTFHLHVQERPEIEENKITITHKGGKLICHVLEPVNVKIQVIGDGDDRFVIGGERIKIDNTDGLEAGWGQIMISPGTKQKADRFVVRMEIRDR